MSEDRKRSRKSKIEVRKCDSDVVYEKEVTTPISQNIIKPAPKIIRAENLTRYEHDYCLPGYQRYGKSHSSPCTFRVPSPVSSVNPVIAVHTTEQGLCKSTPDINNSPLVSILKDRINREKSTLKKMGSHLVEKRLTTNCTNNAIKMCKYNPDLLLEMSQRITSESMNLADKILDIELRNMWGNILHTPQETDPYEDLLQKTIEIWQVWMHGWKNIRKSPLCYQCHVCTLAWWRLHDFRQHIRTHDSKRLRLSLKELVHECMFVASYEPATKLIFIDIDENCWKCGRDMDFHKDNSCVYQCDRCQKSLYTCEKRLLHESECLYPNRLGSLNISEDRVCTVCCCILDSLGDIENHMIQVHSVRSDLPSPNSFKTCSSCKGKYFTFSEHNCSKSAKNAGCNFCCRKFATKQLALTHMHSPFNRDTECRLCFKLLENKCMEMEHIFAYHSDNYQLAYKCTICANQYLLFIDEVSVKKHKQLWHRRKNDKRRNYYEPVLVPKQCLLEGSIEEAFQKGSEPELCEQSHISKYRTDDDEDFSLPGVPRQPNKIILTPEIDVIVDEVDIKKEPVEYDENGEIDYEEMLKNMFNIKSDEPKSPQPSISNTTPSESNNSEGRTTKNDVNLPTNNIEQNTPSQSTDFDLANVKIKDEPMDDIDIMENPVENIQIKSEPIDNITEDSATDDQDKTYTDTDTKEHFIFHIKDEPIDGEHPSVQTYKVVPTQTAKPRTPRKVTKKTIIISKRALKSKIKAECAQNATTSDDHIFEKLISGYHFKHTNKKNIETPDTNEVTFKVVNPRGACKEKRVYACKLCGYTAPHKQYRIHKETLCAVSGNSRSSSKPEHRCSKCGLNFVMFRDYVLHFDRHGYDMMTCPVCNMAFDFHQRLFSHVQKHIKADYVGIRLLKKGGVESTKAHKKVKCRKCNKVIAQSDMFSHWESHLSLKTLSCESEAQLKTEDVHVKTEPPELDESIACERVTMNSKALDPAALKAAIDHLTATSDIDKACAVCQRVFVRRSDAKRHVVEHLLMDAHVHRLRTNNLLRCQICMEGFNLQESYKFHMREHGAMPIFKCELCNKNFSDSSNFAKHKKTHNVRVLICDICQKKFHSRQALEKHIAEHATQVKIKCSICSKICMTPTLYRKHKYQAHMKNKYKCKLCEINFDTLQHKWDHDWQVHKQRKHKADCPICQKSFRKFHDVKIHARLEHKTGIKVIKMKRAALLFSVDNDVKEEQDGTIVVYE